MTSLERIATALQHKEADRVPAVPFIMGVSRRVKAFHKLTIAFLSHSIRILG